MRQKNFAMIGAAGYIAPRHMKAIAEIKGKLLAALDPSDSVGILDSFFPDADFFVELERFDRHLDRLIREGIPIHFLSVCSPNYLHDSHIRFGLRLGADVICEKPLVLNPWNVDALSEMEYESGKKIYTILQLRWHPSMIDLHNKVSKSRKIRIYDIDLTYLTARGNWYYTSWKGDEEKSGGIATNIGIHFFDVLIWIFGGVKRNVVHLHTHDRAAGYLELERARVRWFLSINEDVFPEEIKRQGKRTYRSLVIDGEEVEFSEGFEELHTLSYRKILHGEGFGIDEVRSSIQLAHDIRNAEPVGFVKPYHPLVETKLSPHPFR